VLGCLHALLYPPAQGVVGEGDGFGLKAAFNKDFFEPVLVVVAVGVGLWCTAFREFCLLLEVAVCVIFVAVAFGCEQLVSDIVGFFTKIKTSYLLLFI
jgi:hypothetical protein